MPPFGTRMHRTRRDPLAAHRRARWLDMKAVEAAPPGKRRLRQTLCDYSNRSGFPRPIKARRASR
jgi:hypothetical protein